MSDNNINVTAPLHAATKKGKLGAAKEIFLEGDTQTVEKEIQDINSRHNTLNTKHESLNKTVQGIAATGGASTATNVTYDNTNSGMTAENIQDAVDKLAKEKADSSDVTKQLDKVTIKDEEGTVVDTPFRYIQNEEFIFAKIDAEDKLLFGIQWDGTPKFGKTSEVEDELQEQITILAERVAAIVGDEDITSTIDTLNELKTFFANIENTQSLIDILDNLDKTVIKDEEGNIQDTPFRVIENPEFFKVITDSEDRFLCGIQHDGSIEWSKGIPSPIRAKLQEIVSQIQLQITNLQETKVDKEEGKSLIENEVKECFKVIENEEFIKAITDADDKVLFGIYRDSGKPYFPLNEMYHVEQNKEFFAVWLDASDHVLLGIRRDGQIIGEIHAVNALKETIKEIKKDIQDDISSLRDEVGVIDSNLKELLDIFSLQENPEYMAVEKDADGKVLSATYNDGSHYIHNAKSETIPEEFEHIEDPEGRTEITTDAEGKVMSCRDSSGKKYEHDMEVTNLDVSNINLQGNSVKDIGDALKANDFKLDTPSDFSKDSYIELPIPRIAAQVRLYAPKLPTTKQDDIEAEIEYNDKDGNYFRKPIILNAQGSSSMNYYVKNMAIDINDDSKIKFGDFPSQDSFHLKKYYIDVFRGQCIVGYWLMEQVYQTRPVGNRYPYEILSKAYSPYTGTGKADDDFYTGSKCHPDGFPIVITWVNSDTKEEKNMGIYAWNLKKSKEVYHANKKTAENIILDGIIDNVTLFGGTIDWTQFEIRNPKSLIDIDGGKYDGDNPKELSDTDKNSKKVKDYLVRLSGVKNALAESNTKETFEKYFIVDSFIDYFIVSQVLYNLDGFRKNWIWCTWDGVHWAPTLYDVDSIFGAHWNGTLVVSGSDNSIVLGTENVLGLDKLYATEIKERYRELRNDGVFTTKNIANLLELWLGRTGYDNIEKELSLYTDIPSYRNPQLNDGWKIVGTTSSSDDYDTEKTYSKGNICVYFGYRYQATKEVTGVPPLKSFYEHEPIYCGFYNSVKRVSAWLDNRIAFLDKTYEYNNV